MSAIAGIYSRHGAPIDRRLLEELSIALRQRGPDGESFTFMERVAMLHRPFHLDRESRFTPQPLQGESGTLICWDGRLDNREDLHPHLQASLPTHSRALDYFLATYEAWGIDGFVRLVGDFAVAIWDPRQERLVLAADSMGLCPLYHHTTEDFVYWSSSARSLVEALGLEVELDEGYIADFLTEPNPTERSPFKKVRAVPGSHALVADREKVETRRYWQIDPHREIRYRRQEDYQNHFREVFDEAVACRLQTDAPVFAELSGGLDSSSIVCVGDLLRRDGRVSAPDIHTVSYVYDTSPAADERPYMREIEEQRGRQGIHIRDEDHPILSPIPPELKADLPSSQVSFHGRRTALVDAMKEKGARVVLRGEAGDQLFWGDLGKAPFDLADYLRYGRLLKLLQTCRGWSRVLRVPFLKMLWQGACWPLLPRWLQAKTFFLEPQGEWLDRDFVKRLDFEERLLGPRDDVGFRSPSNRRQYTLVRAATRLYALQLFAPNGHVEAYYPFLDRRLVEFALALPVEEKLRVGETRSVVRRSLKGVLPETVRTRQTKGGPTQAFQRALIREWPWLKELLTEPRVCDLGIVDRDAFAATMQRARHGVLTHPSLLLRTISLELWLRSFETDVASSVRHEKAAL